MVVAREMNMTEQLSLSLSLAGKYRERGVLIPKYRERGVLISVPSLTNEECDTQCL